MLSKIIKYDHLGRGITNDKKITFIPRTIIDEEIEYELVKETKKYNEGRLTKIINESSNRIKPLCSYFNECNGCQLRHMTYEESIHFKETKLKDIFKRYLNIDYDIKVFKSKDNYRNKLTLKIVNNDIGYYKENTHEVIKINSCLNVKKSINEFIKDISLFNIHNGEIVVRSNYNDELLISITTDDEIVIPKLNHKIVGIIINDKVIKGESFFIELINNFYFKVSYNSFFQINSDINKELFDLLNSNIDNNTNLLDLYCGVGSLGISTSKKVKKIIGIDNNESNIMDAIYNAKINKVANAFYVLNDATKAISKIKEKIDVVIIDPPRHGLTTNGINDLFKVNANKIIYISCDPMTLVRDLKTLTTKYDISYIEGFDMFPYTYHVECLCVLKRH